MASRMARKSGGSFIGNFFKRGIKFVISAAILSVFVLGIVFFVKQASSATPSKLVSFLSPYLSKIGLREEQVGEVAGDLIKRATDFGVGSNLINDDISSSSITSMPVATVAILADSHIASDTDEHVENKSFLVSALNKVIALQADQIVHVGDITNYGVEADLIAAKEILDEPGIDYVAIPGDRDLAATSNLDAFSTVFGVDSHTLEYAGNKFVVFNNSANYTLIPQSKMNWFEEQLNGADFVILSQPLYTEDLLLFNCQYMGSSCSEPEDAELKAKQAEVKKQRDELLSMIRSSNVRAVIAGDHHRSSQTQDKDKPGLVHYVVGAIGGSLNDYSQNALQTQRFTILKLYENGAFTVEDIIL